MVKSMDEYFYVLTAINVFVLAFMSILVNISETLNSKQRSSFFTAYLLIAVISVIEVVTVIVDQEPTVHHRYISIFSNFIGFGLTPFVPICLVNVLTKKVDAKLHIKAAYLFGFIYLTFLAISLPYEFVFSVNSDNEYSRGPGFPVYLVTYYLSMLYLMIATLSTAKYFQNRSRLLIYPITIFMMIGTATQVLFPHIHITCLCVTLISVMYFIYCNEMWNQLDGLTGLLNQNSYLNRTAERYKSDKGLIVFDVDNFKQVNDIYGHLNGDICLIEVADCIKKAYSRYGHCYRIGGDEFCVLMHDKTAITKCTDKFIKLLEKKRQQIEFIPAVSYGFAELSSNENILDAKERADKNMYIYKRERKRRETVEAAFADEKGSFAVDDSKQVIL